MKLDVVAFGQTAKVQECVFCPFSVLVIK
ncbi:hypothetical protein NPIL_486191, partial [Nephila pilipes]